MQIDVDLSGLDATLKRMSTLPEKLQKRALRAAVRKGANIIKNAAQANAQQIDDPTTAESIAKNVAVQFSARQSRQQGGVVFRVGIRGGARQYGDTRENRRARRVGQTYKTLGSSQNPGGDTWYWRLVHFGVPSRNIPARPFLLKAMEDNKERALSAVLTELNRQLDRLVTE